MVIGMELPLCASPLCGLQVGRSSELLGDREAELNMGQWVWQPLARQTFELCWSNLE